MELISAGKTSHELHNKDFSRLRLTFIWHAYVPLVEFMHFVFTRMPGESYQRRRSRSLSLCSFDVTGTAGGLILFQTRTGKK